MQTSLVFLMNDLVFELDEEFNVTLIATNFPAANIVFGSAIVTVVTIMDIDGV